MFKITAIPAREDNYIWGLRQNAEAVLVDPGAAGPALDWLEQEGLRLDAILVTHHHDDHQAGIAGLLARFPQARVYGPGNESITGRTHPLHGGEYLQILGVDVDVLSLPGHTLGHLGYLAGDALFCGDVLFGAGCGKIFEGSVSQMFAAMECIAALPDRTWIFCAHEYTLLNLPFAVMVEPGNVAIAERLTRSLAARAAGETTVPSLLLLEKATNPFLRYNEPAVAAKARERDPSARTPEQIFAVLRQWRDTL
jgi:hydroxyacylglutathione hydrolase